MADDSQTFFLNLDITEFTEKALSAKGTISDLGDAQNLSGLLEGILAASTALAAIGIVAYSLKATFDLVFEGEQIQKTTDMFNRLSESMGVAGEKLKSDLVAGAGGLASELDIMNAANKAMITMGGNATHITETMELARKATAAFGGDLTERFQQINQAIASGSQRMLRQNGIMIDVTKAVKDFAASQGVAADMLTEAGRKQAIMNAALEYGRDRFKDVDINQKLAITTAQQFKVSIQEIGEAFAIAFEKIAGPTVRAVMSDLANAARFVKNELVSAFGTGSEQSAAKVELLKSSIEATTATIKKMSQNPLIDPAIVERQKAMLAELQAQLRQVQGLDDEISRKKASQKVQTGSGANPNAEANKAEIVDAQKVADARAKFEDEILKLQIANAKKRVELADNQVELKAAQNAREEALEQQHDQQMADLDRQYKEKKITSHRQYLEMKKQEELKYNQEVKQMEDQNAAEERRMEQNRLNHSKSMWDGMSRAAQVSSAQAKRSLHDFGAQGMMVMDTLKKRGSESFQALGQAAIDHSQSASTIMKGFFLNSLGDIAQAQGELYLAMGIMDPVALAAGAGLLVLAGILHGLAGSAGGGSSSMSGGGGGGGAASGYDSGTNSAAAANAPEQKTVTVQVMGHYFESDQTKTHLMDMLRSVTDATDYKYQQIGSA